MSEEIFEKEFGEIASLIERCGSFLILGHIDPDGDCVGSMLALARFLGGRGKSVKCYAPGEIADVYRKLPDIELFVEVEGLEKIEYEAVFALDSPTTARTAELVGADDGKTVVNIDHHPMNMRYGKVNVVEEKAAATAVLIYRLLSSMAAGEITREIANYLYLGIMMDTGGFRFRSTGAEALFTAGELVRLGVSPHELAREFIYVKKLSTFKILSKVLDSLEVKCGGRVAIMHVARKMIDDNGGSMSDTEGFVDYASSVDEVELSALFREMSQEEIRVSLRSRNLLDVAEVAERYGGGGHRNAAGLTIRADLESAKAMILRDLEQLLAGRNSHRGSIR